MLKRLSDLLLLLVLLTLAGAPAAAEDAELRQLVNQLAVGRFKERAVAVEALVATGDAAVAPALRALGDGELYQRKADGLVVIARSEGDGYRLVDPLIEEELGSASSGEIDKIKVNNRLRREIRAAVGRLTLLSPKAEVRRAAVEAIYKSQDVDALESLEAALAEETDPGIRRAMEEARAAALLKSAAPEADKIAAVAILRARGDRDALNVLSAVADQEAGALREAAASAVAAIEDSLRLWAAGQNVWYGLSLGSVLFLAAIGLAITFGVMGVINMAHGEMVMLGAYTTFLVQDAIRNSAPALFDFSLAFALPLAFLVAGGVGILIERSVIRWLYGRPLETLLATWGLSLILQQAVRSLFGPTNQQVGIPSWMSGAFELGKLTITYNRLWIIVFALLVFVALLGVLRHTYYGLQVRAVTQNRRMADALGIRTPWIDALTFGLGSGIAGIAGVALSQIDNVSPNLGQGYIVDSFMVVVFGGVGSFWGTLVGAGALGIVNKFVEPYAGAVLGKILVLVFIILFIQKRPRGLFALKGRAVEA